MTQEIDFDEQVSRNVGQLIWRRIPPVLNVGACFPSDVEVSRGFQIRYFPPTTNGWTLHFSPRSIVNLPRNGAAHASMIMAAPLHAAYDSTPKSEADPANVQVLY